MFTDLDECSVLGTDNCPSSHYCNNTVGLFNCEPCATGYRADSDGLACTTGHEMCVSLAVILIITETLLSCAPQTSTNVSWIQISAFCYSTVSIPSVRSAVSHVHPSTLLMQRGLAVSQVGLSFVRTWADPAN